ncbi:unnamed protein product [Linum trigynum]|uniref:Homeobox domain-containing protein n=1 Tax=Linum trigynum TaxID=586398 RepID=A0AAV2DDL9_9ROSI
MASSSSVEDHALLLGLTLSTTHHNNRIITPAAKPNNSGVVHSTFEPSLSLTLLSGNGDNIDQVSAPAAAKNSRQEASPPNSAVSSFSAASGGGGRMVMKRERDVLSSTDEMETAERVVSSRASDEDDDGGSTAARKKLRLTKDQSALLEESFKHHSTLNPKQKQALARQLNLRARQVEVWFQNRRARTKLKQTEVDCELLKKCCETLTDENRRLHKELQELKALKSSPPQPAAPPQFYMRVPAATLSLCPSCERIGGGPAVAAAEAPVAGGADHHRGGSNSSSSAFSMAQKPQFFNPFTNPSAAC